MVLSPSEAAILLGGTTPGFLLLTQKAGRSRPQEMKTSILVQLNAFAFDRPTSQVRCSDRESGYPCRSGCCAELTLLPSPQPLAPLPRHPRTSSKARRRRLVGEPRAAEGGAVQTRCGHRSCPVGCGSHLPLDSATTTGAADPAKDASAQRHRSLEHHAENRLAAMFTAPALIHRMGGVI